MLTCSADLYYKNLNNLNLEKRWKYFVLKDGNAQERIAIFMDATSVLDSAIKKANSLGHHSEQTVILLDAIYSILSSQSTAIRTHQPFVNVMW